MHRRKASNVFIPPNLGDFSLHPLYGLEQKFGVNVIMIIFNTTYLLYLLTRSVPPLYFLTLKIKIDEACQI